MFSKNYFGKKYFSGSYFGPLGIVIKTYYKEVVRFTLFIVNKIGFNLER